MKRLFIYLLSILLFVITGCASTNEGTSDSVNSSEGSHGTGEIIDDKKQAKETADVSQYIKHLDFSVIVEQANGAFILELLNNSEETMEIGFSSGQQYEIIVRNKDTNEEVYRFSEGKMFTEALIFKELASKESLTWYVDWEFGSLPPGSYVVTATLMPLNINEIPIDGTPFVKEEEFQIKETINEPSKENGNDNPDNSKKETTRTFDIANNAFRNLKVTGSDGFYTVTGEGRVFEAVFSYHIEDGNQILQEETFFPLNEGAPAWSPFEINIELSKDKLPANGTVTIVLYERSAKDGSPTNEIVLPLEQFNGK
jgi:hypothetical protein